MGHDKGVVIAVACPATGLTGRDRYGTRTVAMDGRRAAADGSATMDAPRRAGVGARVDPGLDERDRRLRRRVRPVLQPGDEVDIAFVMSTTPPVVAGRFRLRRATAPRPPPPREPASSQRLALVVTRGGAVVVARLTRIAGPQLVQRFDTAAAIGVTAVGPGESYLEVAGRRYWVHGVWTYGLYTLHTRGGVAPPPAA